MQEKHETQNKLHIINLDLKCLVVSTKIITKDEAVNQNLKFYFTGKSCKNGHMSLRRTKGGGCTTCEYPSGYTRTKRPV